jgi:hypothetical protein
LVEEAAGRVLFATERAPNLRLIVPSLILSEAGKLENYG